ncbi:hypothetical protein [Halopiger goleimassiliensis]|uniref:hypothetical protein n=1 Tax=Halopiger goleimassiliensis TaxID=1293048 RepID=UPI000677E06B|nr:hypothetical protein [Halopiger goleimassiliensis]
MYEESFGTDWKTIDDRDEIVLRAYALGVATRLGEHHPEELERLTDAVSRTYDRSFVELAYQKGRDDAAASPIDDAEALWEELVEEKIEITPPDHEEDDLDWGDPEGSLPDALGLIDIDTLPDDSTDRVRRPSFLDRESDDRLYGDEERTVFGRPVSDVRGTDADRPDRSSDGDASEPDESPEPNDSESADGEPSLSDRIDELRGRSSEADGDANADSDESKN